MHGCSGRVADHEEYEAVPASVNGLVEHQISKPVPEDALADELNVACPPCGAFARCLAEEEIFPGEAVEVEATKGEDWIV